MCIRDSLAPARAMVAGAARFNIDLDARALLAAGDAVDALVRAGVAPYLDFLPIPRLLYWDGGAAAPTTVPCSKRDVFAAPDVAAADKRRLLRVMQAAQDRGEGAAAATLNERALTASRALRRPQNRSRAARAGDDAAPFAASLAADDGLAPPLARAVAYAVALADSADVPRGAARCWECEWDRYAGSRVESYTRNGFDRRVRAADRRAPAKPSAARRARSARSMYSRRGRLSPSWSAPAGSHAASWSSNFPVCKFSSRGRRRALKSVGLPPSVSQPATLLEPSSSQPSSLLELQFSSLLVF